MTGKYLTLLSHALLASYGGSLTCLHIRHVEGSSDARLGALLQRQATPIKLVVNEQETLPALCQAIVQSCCHSVDNIELTDDLTEGELHSLLEPLEAEGALPVVHILRIRRYLTPDTAVAMAELLARGRVPRLKNLILYVSDESLMSECFALALQVRTTIPGCSRLECFEPGFSYIWMDSALLATQTRFLCVLLPSVKTLRRLVWNEEYEPCFTEAPAPYLTSLIIELENEGVVFSSGVLEAMPALRTLRITSR